MTTKDKRKISALQGRLHRHAKGNCANHIGADGCQATLHGKCVLSFGADRPTANVCPYFMKSVGPSEPELFDEYLRYFPDDYPLKPKGAPDKNTDHCAKCGGNYERGSNRQIYCGDCAKEIRKEQERIRQKKRRLGI